MAKYQIEAYILEKLSSYTPECTNILSDWSHIKDLHLTDPQYYSNVPVELILGADVYAFIIQDGVITGPVDEPVAQRMTLGWISNPTAKIIIVQCASFDWEFHPKNDHFNKKSEAKSKSHLKIPVAKPNEKTLINKDWISHSHKNCWAQGCLLLTTFSVLYSPKSNRNQRKRKITSRKRKDAERGSPQVKSLSTCIQCSFMYHYRVIES